MTTDQAERLRRMAQTIDEARTGRVVAADVGEAPASRGDADRAPESTGKTSGGGGLREQPRLAHATAIVSGKGGVGKSNIAVNLAVALSSMGRRVVLFDADLGMANADVLSGVTPEATLEDVLRGRARLKDILLPGPGGFRLVPGSSGVAAMANLDGLQRRRILGQLSALDRVADHLLIDMGAGISSSVTTFAAAAHRALVVTTPEPTSITDGYGAIKSLIARGSTARIELLVNMAESLEEGGAVHRRVERVVERFLKVPLTHGGTIPRDPALPIAVRNRRPILLDAPWSPSAQAITRLARRIDGRLPLTDEPAGFAQPEPPRQGFFQRVARSLMGRRD
ncbi:MAG: MinD/ParA family protein [Phycisphaerales bacterium]|nr:MinD/ParA family protein [Phycisphaerales bacterium]